jgi:hypothetical protein
VVRTVIALALLAGCGAWYGHWNAHGGGWAEPAQGDHVSAAERSERERAFEALGVTTLQPVAATEIDKAIDAMALTTDARHALQADLGGRAPQDEPAPAPGAAKPERPRLAWIRLWDSDVEDGDVVRIESAGYSRTVTLTKRGDTFAVPVSPHGIVTITGIRDGDGGGITVGVASGTSTALMPIMSTGQTLRIAVTLP